MRKQKINIADLADAWLKKKKPKIKESTYIVYHGVVNRYIIPDFGYEEIDEDLIQAYIAKKLEDGLSIETIKMIILILKGMLRLGAKKGEVANPDWELFYPQTKNTQIRAYTIDEQRRLLNHIRDEIARVKTMKRDSSLKLIGIIFCLTTGMRIGEICGLKWKDIDFETNVVHIRRIAERIYFKNKSEIKITSPKTPSSVRDVPLNLEMKIYLRPYKNLVNPEHYILSNAEKPIETRCYRDFYDRLVKRSGVHRLKFHSLRHTFATRCVESECDYKAVSVILGHASITTTLDLYVHPNMDARRKVIDKMTNYVK